MLSFWLETC